MRSVISRCVACVLVALAAAAHAPRGFAQDTSGGGGDVDEATAFVLEIGPAAAALRDASEDSRAKAASAVREVLAPYETPEGIQLTGGAWLVTATRPPS